MNIYINGLQSPHKQDEIKADNQNQLARARDHDKASTTRGYGARAESTAAEAATVKQPVTRHTSRVTRHTSRFTLHTSHVTLCTSYFKSTRSL